MHDFADFRSAKFHGICTQDVVLRNGAFFQNNFLKICTYGFFSKKNLHFCLIIVNDFRLPAAISPEMITNLRQ